MLPATQRLIRAYTTFSGEIALHKEVFLNALGNQATSIGRDLDLQLFAGWYCLIGLHDAWSRFCREAIVASAVGGVVTRTGSHVVPSPVLPVGTDPLDFLQQHWPRKGSGICYADGPDWYDPFKADLAAKILQINNYAVFSAAILAKADTPTELKACRNYLAHRNAGTEDNANIRKLRSRIKVAATTAHTEKLAEQIVSGNITLFEEWCIELDTIAATAIG
jgi:hypothetical protein